MSSNNNQSIINHKISFCTVSMNRLHHVPKTLPKNITDNSEYDNLEFVLLNYNSSDDIDNWVKTNLISEINSGRLRYYTYYSPTKPYYFHRSHSRNIAFKNASGNIICNIDADNFTGKGFAQYINKFFRNQKRKIFLQCPIDNAEINSNYFGRICFTKNDFMKVGGFDERMSEYGWEEIDFVHRLQRNGIKREEILNVKYLTGIEHHDLERIQEEKSYTSYYSILIQHLNPRSTKLLVLYKNGEFKLGKIIIERNTEEPVLKHNWKTGKWILKNELTLAHENGHCETMQIQNSSISQNGNSFRMIKDTKFESYLKKKIPSLTNKRKMLDNELNNIIRVNYDGFGLGKVKEIFNSNNSNCINGNN